MCGGTNKHVWGPQTIAGCQSLLEKIILKQNGVSKRTETWI